MYTDIDGMEAAKKGFKATIKSEQRTKDAVRWTKYFNLANAVLVLIGSLLTLIVQWLMKLL